MIEVTWLQDTIILIQIPPEGTWDDFHAAFDEAFAMAQHDEGAVGILFDTAETPNPPDNKVMTHMRAMSSRRPANVHAIAVVAPNRVATRLIEVFVSLTGLDLHIAPSREAAITYLNEHHPAP